MKTHTAAYVDAEEACDKFQHPFMTKTSQLSRNIVCLLSKTGNKARMSDFTTSTLYLSSSLCNKALLNALLISQLNGEICHMHVQKTQFI